MGQIKNTNLKKKYKHICFEERVIIKYLRINKSSKTYIAKELWRDRKTIEREIKRNWYYKKRWHLSYKVKNAEVKRKNRRLYRRGFKHR